MALLIIHSLNKIITAIQFSFRSQNNVHSRVLLFKTYQYISYKSHALPLTYEDIKKELKFSTEIRILKETDNRINF